MFVAVMTAVASAGDDKDRNHMRKSRRWVAFARGVTDGFFNSPEAGRIGDNLLLYQHHTGGWAKNVNMARYLDRKERKRVEAAKGDSDESTIDNGATTTEITYLARLYNATGKDKYRRAAERGIDYLLEAQYDNGGWPQFYPRRYGYYRHITYNDGAMINVMRLLDKAAHGIKPFTFLADSTRERASRAVEKGIDCILKTQVRQNGEPTVWCAQHDEHTLQPAKARAYELVSLSGSESAGVVLFLMSLPDPSEDVKKSIEAAVEWFRQSAVKGLYKDYFTDEKGRRDYRMKPCPQDDFPCHPLWARFYTIDGNRPFFCDRDGIVRYDISEIGYERRNGYSWYNEAGAEVLNRYDEWRKTHGKEN